MPIEKDACVVQAVFAFSQGAAGARISGDASSWFHQRYAPWIAQEKPGQQSPHQVWDAEGPGFLERFKLIGQRAAQSAASRGGTIESTDLESSALSVEQESECPYCP